MRMVAPSSAQACRPSSGSPEHRAFMKKKRRGGFGKPCCSAVKGIHGVSSALRMRPVMHTRKDCTLGWPTTPASRT
jgi:hypothetical protein